MHVCLSASHAWDRSGLYALCATHAPHQLRRPAGRLAVSQPSERGARLTPDARGIPPPPPLCQVVSDPKLSKSGAYWSWSSSTGSFDNQVSEEVADDAKATKLWDVSAKLVGLSA